jgi:hypothetical protein
MGKVRLARRRRGLALPGAPTLEPSSEFLRLSGRKAVNRFFDLG